MNLLLLLSGCITLQKMAPDLPCREAAYAIASRTETCSGDLDLANSRYEAFEATYDCIAVDVTDPDFNGPALSPDDLFDCPLSIRELPCELTDAYGDDLDRWLLVSNACPWVIARKDGLPIGFDSEPPTLTPDTGTPRPTDTGTPPTDTGTTIEPPEPSPPQQCLRTDGSPDRLVADGALLPYGNSARTVELWLRTEPGASAPMVAVAYGDGGYLSTLQLGVLYGLGVADWGGASLQTGTEVNDGALHHLAFVHDGVVSWLVLDGQRQTTFPGIDLDTVQASPLVIGNSIDGGADLGFQGWIGDVRIWDQPLSDAQIRDLIHGNVDPDADGLLRWYAMEPETGAYTVVANSGGNRGGVATVEGDPGFEGCEP